MLYQIKSWLNGSVLFEAECESLKICVELAVSKNISLSYADLNYAELNHAKLNYAKLNDAELNHAELTGAELNGAKLNDAKLNYAKLNYAKLNGAKLTGAELNDAELIRMDGLKYSVIISPTHIHIGCKRFTHAEYRSLDAKYLSKYSDAAKQKHIVDAVLNARWPQLEE